MTWTSYSDDAHAIGMRDAGGAESVENSGSAAHQRCCMFGGDRRRDFEDVGCLPNRVGAKRALVSVGDFIGLVGGTHVLMSGEALSTLTAGGVHVAPAYTISNLESGDCATELLIWFSILSKGGRAVLTSTMPTPS